MTNKEHAAGQEVKTSPGETASGPVSAASPLDYPAIPADLRRQIREERRELVEALRNSCKCIVELVSIRERTDLKVNSGRVLDENYAILAREGGKQ